MQLADLTAKLQACCHNGLSCHEVEVYNRDGKRMCAIDDIRIADGNDGNVRIIIHTEKENVIAEGY